MTRSFSDFAGVLLALLPLAAVAAISPLGPMLITFAG